MTLRSPDGLRRIGTAVALLCLALLLPDAQARIVRTQAAVQSTPTTRIPAIEVFVDSEQRVALSPGLESRVTLYRVDGIEMVEGDLGDGLPADPVLAEVEAQRRFNAMTVPYLESLKQAARGLGKAIEYGINRYPAIVFDSGQAVVYGLLDIDTALGFYQQRPERP